MKEVEIYKAEDGGPEVQEKELVRKSVVKESLTVQTKGKRKVKGKLGGSSNSQLKDFRSYLLTNNFKRSGKSN